MGNALGVINAGPEFRENGVCGKLRRLVGNSPTVSILV
jgi:hypothetical protein